MAGFFCRTVVRAGEATLPSLLLCAAPHVLCVSGDTVVYALENPASVPLLTLDGSTGRLALVSGDGRWRGVRFVWLLLRQKGVLLLECES